jgi:hypothetical protein
VGHSPGVTHSVIAAVALVVTLALSFIAYIIGQQNLNIQQAVAYSHGENVKTALMEKLSLIYWDFSGKAWIQNIGEVPVTIVKVYIDDQEVWTGSGRQPLTIQPGETVRIDLPYRGSVLAVETSTGSIYILRR